MMYDDASRCASSLLDDRNSPSWPTMRTYGNTLSSATWSLRALSQVVPSSQFAID